MFTTLCSTNPHLSRKHRRAVVSADTLSSTDTTATSIYWALVPSPALVSSLFLSHQPTPSASRPRLARDVRHGTNLSLSTSTPARSVSRQRPQVLVARPPALRARCSLLVPARIRPRPFHPCCPFRGQFLGGCEMRRTVASSGSKDSSPRFFFMFLRSVLLFLSPS
jgi:hypothetical protein